MKNVWRAVLTALWLTVALAGATGAARAEPAQVTVGTYINKIQDVSFRDNRYVVDFYVWFRWKPEGARKDYQPLESVEMKAGVFVGLVGRLELGERPDLDLIDLEGIEHIRGGDVCARSLRGR